MQGLIRVFQGDLVDHPLVCGVVEWRMAVRGRPPGYDAGFPNVDFVLKIMKHRGHAGP